MKMVISKLSKLPMNKKIYFLIIVCVIASFTNYNYAQRTEYKFSSLNKIDSLNLNAYSSPNDILLNSNPQDVYVFYKDSLIGNTPLFLPNSFSELTLKKYGFDSLVVSGSQIAPGKIFTLKSSNKPMMQRFYEKDIFKILTAGIVILGGTTAYFKLKADNKFDAYQFSGDDSLLSETRKYDLISGITFTALQLNFGLLLYYFLVE